MSETDYCPVHNLIQDKLMKVEVDVNDLKTAVVSANFDDQRLTLVVEELKNSINELKDYNKSEKERQERNNAKFKWSIIGFGFSVALLLITEIIKLALNGV